MTIGETYNERGSAEEEKEGLPILERSIRVDVTGELENLRGGKKKNLSR